MIVAGIGCRRGCTAADIVAVVREAEARSGCTAGVLAAPEFKRHEPGLHRAAALLQVPLRFVAAAALTQAQPQCATHSAAAFQAFGIASVAEGAALAEAGTPLRLARISYGAATCALAGQN